MNVEFPKLADTLVDGLVSAWYKKPGDAVRKGEPLFAVETDKVNTDVESPYDGTLAEIVVGEGERAEVGHLRARFETHATAPGEHTAVARPIAPPAPAQSTGGLSAMRKRIAERMTE